MFPSHHAHGTYADKSYRSADFLSSIEILVVDQMDALTMQNWEHVQVADVLQRAPSQTHDHPVCLQQPEPDAERVARCRLLPHQAVVP
jgi:hypothetical protein